MILITSTFKKSLKKIKSISIDDIKSEIRKYQNGLPAFIELYFWENKRVLKGYLLSSKVRIILISNKEKTSFIPILLLKKESRKGYNISIHEEDYINKEIEKHIIDIQNQQYDKIKL